MLTSYYIKISNEDEPGLTFFLCLADASTTTSPQHHTNSPYKAYFRASLISPNSEEGSLMNVRALHDGRITSNLVISYMISFKKKNDLKRRATARA